jgi:hypothetical protein
VGGIYSLMMLPFQIQIPKRNQVCSLCGEALSPGMDYFSSLIENDNNEYERLDYCQNCWNKEFLRNKLPAKFWKSKVPLKKMLKIIPQDQDGRILSLLRSSLMTENEESWEEGFVLALYLARRRRLFLRNEIVQKDQTILQVYELIETEEMIGVKKINLREEQVEVIQLRIAKLLKE